MEDTAFEVVDPDANATDRLHVVSMAEAAKFCRDRPPMRGDYFRKMLRCEQEEHRGWMLRATVSGRWIRHTVTGEYVAVVGKVRDFIKTCARERLANDMPFKSDGDALAKLLAGTQQNNGIPSDTLHKWEKVGEPLNYRSRLNKSTPPPALQVLPRARTFFRIWSDPRSGFKCFACTGSAAPRRAALHRAALRRSALRRATLCSHR
jgi:hypothetical protein